MARGTDPINDPRWDGQDSQSLPDRPAHPDPSRVAQYGDPATTASHGIVGHLDAKHGLFSDDDVRARRAEADRVLRQELENDRDAARQQAQVSQDPAKARVQSIEQSLKALGSPDKQEDGPVSLAEAVQRGDVVPSIEATYAGGDEDSGKREKVAAQNAPAEKG
jgi:hypothetical protein